MAERQRGTERGSKGGRAMLLVVIEGNGDGGVGPLDMHVVGVCSTTFCQLNCELHIQPLVCNPFHPYIPWSKKKGRLPSLSSPRQTVTVPPTSSSLI
jgi:hypothetical protein